MNKKLSILASLLLCSNIANAGWQDITGDLLKTVTETTKKSTSPTNTTLSESTISNGLKEALKKGVDVAVTSLGKDNGYLNNSLVKIPLPDNLSKVETIVRKAGGEKIVNDLITSMNNAASQAAPKTAKTFINAIEKMSINDATKILNGNENEATNYFKTNTYEDLKKLISPIVKQSIADNSVATYYDSFNSFYKTNAKGIVESSSIMQYAKTYGVDSYIPSGDDKDLDEFITQKAIDGLFVMIEKEEKAIRSNPVERTSDLLKKVFGN